MGRNAPRPGMAVVGPDQTLGLTIGGGIIGAFILALIGAVVVLLIVKAVRRA